MASAVKLPFAYSLVGGNGNSSEPFGFYDEPVGTIGDDLLVTLRFPIGANGLNVALHRIGNDTVETIQTEVAHTEPLNTWLYGHNDSGTSVIVTRGTAGTDYQLVVVTPDGGGGMTVTHSSHTSAAWSLPYVLQFPSPELIVAQDGQAFGMSRPNGAFPVFDIDGTKQYQIAAASSKQAVALFSVDRWLQLDSSTTTPVTGGYDQYIRLKNDSGTTLDSDTVVETRTTAYALNWAPRFNGNGIGGMYIKGSDGNGFQYAVAIPTTLAGTTIDFQHRHYSCAGDVLTRTYTAATNTTTNWNANFLSFLPTVWQGVLGLVPAAYGSPPPSSTILWIGSDGSFVESDTYAPTPYIGERQVQCGATALTAYVYYSQEDWWFWHTPAATAPTYLRQRQSPLATPSRVRGVDLRQRQTTRITRP